MIDTIQADTIFKSTIVIVDSLSSDTTHWHLFGYTIGDIPNFVINISVFLTALVTIAGIGYKYVRPFFIKVDSFIDEFDPEKEESLMFNVKKISTDLESMGKEMSKMKYRAIAYSEINPHAMFETDIEGNCIRVNKAWTVLTGLNIDAAEGDGWLNCVSISDRSSLKNAFIDSIKGKSQMNHSFKLINVITDKEYDVTARTIPIRNGNDFTSEIFEIIGIVEINTKKKSAKKTINT